MFKMFTYFGMFKNIRPLLIIKINNHELVRKSRPYTFLDLIFPNDNPVSRNYCGFYSSNDVMNIQHKICDKSKPKLILLEICVSLLWKTMFAGIIFYSEPTKVYFKK